MIIFPIESRKIIFQHIIKALNDENLLENVLPIYTKDFLETYELPKHKYLVDDFKNIDKLILKIEKYLKDEQNKGNKIILDNIIGIDQEESFEYTKKIAKHFNIKTYSDEAFKIASNKDLMKKKFFQYNIPCAKSLIIESAEECKNKIEYPNVIKLITGCESIFTFLNKNESELKKNIDYIQTQARKIDDIRLKKIESENHINDPIKHFLVEEYLTGDEYSCDFIKHNNTINIIRIVKKYDSKEIGIFDGYYLMNDKTLNKNGVNLSELKNICEKISISFGFKEGLCMVDFKIDTKKDSKIKIIESSIRPGFSSFIELMYHSYGYTSINFLVKMMLKKNFNVVIPNTESMIIYIWGKKYGTLTEFSIDDKEISKKMNIIKIKKYNKEGDSFSHSDLEKDELLFGYITIDEPSNSGMTPEEIITYINDNTKIKII